MGLVCGLVYLVTTFLFIPVPFVLSKWDRMAEVWQELPLERLSTYLSALLSLTCMILLGFADDVLDLRWRVKLHLPTVASVPLLMVYAVTSGVTFVVVPVMFRPLLGRLIDLGPLYYVYMGMLAVFCTNSINILSGINGLESGQALVIALSLSLNSLLYVCPRLGELVVDAASLSRHSVETHMFSLYLILPFLGVTLALYLWNRYPARVFVGDVFCYFAGMTFAVIGILGHYSKTLLLFFIPQLLNFIISLPQLFRFVPCPRHRLPRYVLLHQSTYRVRLMGKQV
jgi:UDP-N-acetylglucosamine--dolichyl-phosphate N-acetylglucosaminephosphotransferase